MYIKDLIKRFHSNEKLPQSGPLKSSADTVSFQAHREAEKIDDKDHLGELENLVKRAKTNVQIQDISFILGWFIKNTGSSRAKELYMELCNKKKIGSATIADLIARAAVANLTRCYPKVIEWMNLEVKRNYHYQEALEYLGLVIGQEAIPVIGEALDNDCYGRCFPFYCAIAFEKIGDKKAIPYLQRAIERHMKGRKQWQTDVVGFSKTALLKLEQQA